MPAYVIAEIDVTDPEGYEQYKTASTGAAEKYGARFVVRGGEVRPLEGGWEPSRVVVLEFDSLDDAQRWYDSPEYSEAKAIRQRASSGRFILVQGA